MTNKIEQFTSLANKALAAYTNGKQAKADNTNLQNALSFLTLQILVTGKIQDTEHLRKAFSKEGPYQAIRMVLTRAKGVASALVITPELSYKVREETVKVSLAEVKAWDSETEPLFNVSSAYNSLKADKEASPVDIEALAIEAFLEAKNIEKASFKEHCNLNPEFRQEAITQGTLILADKEKAEAIQNIPNMVKSIRNQMDMLKTVDPVALEYILAEYAPKSQAVPFNGLKIA